MAGHSVFQLKVTLAGVEPAVWRRLQVPGNTRLDKLHRVLQVVMGWQDSHLHNFRIGDAMYGVQEDDYPDDELDETSVTIAAALGVETSFTYDYDYGDGWEHGILVEDERPTRVSLKFAVCLDGENACPPEDCGGPSGYSHLLRVLADPTSRRASRWATSMTPSACCLGRTRGASPGTATFVSDPDARRLVTTGKSDEGAKSLEVWVPGEGAPVVQVDGLTIDGQRKVSGGWLLSLTRNASSWSLTVTGS